MRLQRVEIQRDIIHRRRQQARGRTARLIRLEGLPFGHATSSLNHIQNGRARRQQVNARLRNTARDRIAAQALAPVLFDRVQNLRPFAADFRHPIQRFDVVNQGWAVEHTNLRHKRRTVTRQALFAFDRFDHRGFFTANVGTSTTAQINVTRLNNPGLLQRSNLGSEDFQHRRVFIAHVDKAGFRLDRPCGDQHALKEDMRRALKVVTVFERTRLALIAVHGQIAGTFVHANKAPFLARREASPTQTPQARGQDIVLHLLPITIGAQLFQLGIAAFGLIGGKSFVIGQMRVGVIGSNRSLYLLGRRMVDMVVTDLKHRGGIATAHARRAEDTHLRCIKPIFQRLLQLLGTCHFARQGITHPNGQRRRRRLIFFHHIEMRVEGRGFINLGLTDAHLDRQGSNVVGTDMAVRILNQMQKFDQQIATTGAVPQQASDLGLRLICELTAFGRVPPFAFT